MLKESNDVKRPIVVFVVVVVTAAAGLLHEVEIANAKLRPSSAKQDKNCSNLFSRKYKNIVGRHLCYH